MIFTDEHYAQVYQLLSDYELILSDLNEPDPNDHTSLKELILYLELNEEMEFIQDLLAVPGQLETFF